MGLTSKNIKIKKGNINYELIKNKFEVRKLFIDNFGKKLLTTYNENFENNNPEEIIIYDGKEKLSEKLLAYFLSILFLIFILYVLFVLPAYFLIFILIKPFYLKYLIVIIYEIIAVYFLIIKTNLIKIIVNKFKYRHYSEKIIPQGILTNTNGENILFTWDKVDRIDRIRLSDNKYTEHEHEFIIYLKNGDEIFCFDDYRWSKYKKILKWSHNTIKESRIIQQ
ncbi:hypothetical protein ACX8XN_08355 [Calditrichota bacterium GD2]